MSGAVSLFAVASALGAAPAMAEGPDPTPSRLASGPRDDVAQPGSATATRPDFDPSFAEEISGDPCERARLYRRDDTSAGAEHARRECRLQAFERRLASERQQAVAMAEEAEIERVQSWMERTQPTRVIRPLSANLVVGRGLVTYAVAVAWDLSRYAEVGAWIGRHPITCANQFSATGGDCTRTAYGFGGRWMFLDRDLTPFVGAGFASTSSHVAIYDQSAAPSSSDNNSGPSSNPLLSGGSRAHSLEASAGALLSFHGLRLSLAYVFEYVFYTGANQDDMDHTPNDVLRGVWADSLQQDRHGVRLEIGYAF